MAASTTSEADTASNGILEPNLTHDTTEDGASQQEESSSTSLESVSLAAEKSTTSVVHPEKDASTGSKEDIEGKVKEGTLSSELQDVQEDTKLKSEREVQLDLDDVSSDGTGSFKGRDKLTGPSPSAFRILDYATMIEDRIRFLEREVKRLTNRTADDTKDMVHNDGGSLGSAHDDEWTIESEESSGDDASVVPESVDKETDGDLESQKDTKSQLGKKGESDSKLKKMKVTFDDKVKKEKGEPDDKLKKEGLPELEPVCKMVGRSKFNAHMAREEEIRTVLVAYVHGDGTLTSEKLGANTTGDKRDQRILKLCINSDIIWKFLDRKIPISASRVKGEDVLLSPFKVICRFEDDIRKHLASCIQNLANTKAIREDAEPDLEAQNLPDENLDDNTETDQAKQLSVEELEQNVSHFQCLVDLMDGSLKDNLARHNRYRRVREAETIAFDDLWHLFEPGDLVYTDDDTKQACRVLYVSGGRPLYSPTTEPVASRPDTGEGATYVLSSVNQAGPFIVTCIYINYDGNYFGPVKRTFEIPFFNGEKVISLLPVYPIQYASKVKEATGLISRRDYQIKRGEKFRRLTEESFAHREYRGKTLIDRNLQTGVVLDTSKETRAGFLDIVDSSRSREQVDSQIIIDFEHAFLQNKRIPTLGLPDPPSLNPLQIPQDLHHRPYAPNDKEEWGTLALAGLYYDEARLDQSHSEEFLRQDEARLQYKVEGAQLTDDHCVLLPNLVYGYVLRNLQVYPLDLELVEDFKAEKRTSFQELVLDDQNRRMVESLVSSHANLALDDVDLSSLPASDRADLVRGKGRGLIILLHGIPGTGKSSTAECVAEWTGRPLFPITCGNIGVTAEQVQKNLEAMFYLAHKWNCVMLLDEADVFLRARDAQDMERNAVVSVFLKALEYYAGILFLTTNKVGKIDEAFKSRIHVSLYYDKLSKLATQKVWEVNLNRTAKLKPHIKFDKAEILKFARKHWEKNEHLPWNGRQIRNAFQSATALAEFEAAQKKEDTNEFSLHENGYIHAEMKKSHFKDIAALSAAFDRYLMDTLGLDDFDKAAQNLDRNDRPQASALKATAAWQDSPFPGMQGSSYSTRSDAYAAADTPRSSRKSEKSKSSKKERVIETPTVDRRRKDAAPDDDSDDDSSSSGEKKKSKKSKKNRKVQSESDSDSDSSS